MTVNMRALASRLDDIAPSSTLAISQKAAELKKQGVDVVSYSAGEPDFNTPAHIVKACNDALAAGMVRYPPVGGIPELRQAVADKLRVDNDLAAVPAEVVITVGAKQALYNSFLVLLNPGDEVLVPAPYWVSYPDQIRMVGGVPVVVPTLDTDDFAPTREQLDAMTTKRTRAIVFSSPSNPAGTLYSAATLRVIGEWARDNDAWIISDEIYEKLLFEGTHQSILNVMPELRDQTVLVNGFSKAYAMTGWRVGYSVAVKPVTDAILKVQGHINTNTAIFAQKAAVAALTGEQQCVEDMRLAFDKRRQLMVRRLEALNDVTVPTPKGAFYCFPNVSRWYGRTIGGKKVSNSVEFAAVCLEQAHVAMVPGDGFGMDGHVRLSYACSEAQIDKGLDRLATLLQ
ncbi:MAG: pyridoxal phosphate-dependent aminotransferase [Planctomycetota bacterium]